MDYQTEAGHHGSEGGVMYLPPDATFMGGPGLEYGKNEGLCVVPVCQGSGSSEASDDGTLLRLPFADTPRCDSSRSETGESSCSSASEEDGVRLPVILPPGFAPGFAPMQYPPGLLRVSQRNPMRIVKPGEHVEQGGVYYLKPEGRSAPMPAQQLMAKPDIGIMDPNGVYYIKQTDHRGGIGPKRPEPEVMDQGGVYFLKNPNAAGQQTDPGVYYMKAPMNNERFPVALNKPDPDPNVYYVKHPGDACRGPTVMNKPPDAAIEHNGVYYVKAPHERQFMTKPETDQNALYYLKPQNEPPRVANVDPNEVYYVRAPSEGVRMPPLVAKSGHVDGNGIYYVKGPNAVPRMPMVAQPGDVIPSVMDQSGVYYVKPPENGLVQKQMVPQPTHPVPAGWRRLVVENSVIYLSPSNVALNTMEEVKTYLQSPGTCKCGLECPIHPHITFNFNPKVASQPWDPSDSKQAKLCNHKRKPPEPEQKVPAAAPPPIPVVKKKKKKQATYAGVSVSQLLAQRERERAIAASNAPQQPRWPPASQFPMMRPPDAMFPPRPPWQQRKMASYERVPPLQQHMPPPAPFPLAVDDHQLRKKHKPKRKSREPTFMDDPNGYLAQQTALLHNTIARPNYGVPLPSNVLVHKKPHMEDRGESPVTSTVVSDPRPIQGGTVSTSNGSPPLCAPPAQSPGSVVVSSSLDPPMQVNPRKNQMEMVQTVMSNIQTSSASNGHILVSNTGQYLSGLKLGQSQPVGTVLVNALPAPFVLQQGVMAMDTGLGLLAGNVLVDNQHALVSPEKKKRAKKRKATPMGSPVLHVPPPGNVLVNQGFGGMQALTLVQGKPMVMNNPINVVQPMMQQLLVPGLGNMVMATATDGTTALLPDPGLGQLQLQPLITNTSFISTPTGMLIRSPNSLVSQMSPPEYIQILPQSSAAVVQQNTTIVQQQTTMMANMEKQPLELEIVPSSETQHSVSTQTSVGKETSHTFCQTVGSPPPVVDTTTDDITHVSSSVGDDYFSPSAADESTISSHSDASAGAPTYIDAGDTNSGLNCGDVVWGAARGSAPWPGQMVSAVDEKGSALVKWFGKAPPPPSRVLVADLQTLSEGLDAHHQASNTTRRTRKFQSELEAAIQEAMLVLDQNGV